MRRFHSRYGGSGLRDTTSAKAYRPAPSLRRYRSSLLAGGGYSGCCFLGRRRVLVLGVAELVGAVGAEGDQVRIGRLGELRLHGHVVVLAGRERASVPAGRPVSDRSASRRAWGNGGSRSGLLAGRHEAAELGSDRGSVVARPAIARPDRPVTVEPTRARTPRPARAGRAERRRPRAPARPAASAGSAARRGRSASADGNRDRGSAAMAFRQIRSSHAGPRRSSRPGGSKSQRRARSHDSVGRRRLERALAGQGGSRARPPTAKTSDRGRTRSSSTRACSGAM